MFVLLTPDFSTLELFLGCEVKLSVGRIQTVNVYFIPHMLEEGYGKGGGWVFIFFYIYYLFLLKTIIFQVHIPRLAFLIVDLCFFIKWISIFDTEISA